MPKLSEKDLAVYKEALDLKEEVENLGFIGYNFEDYKIIFEDG